jgi:hypothetical protein
VDIFFRATQQWRKQTLIKGSLNQVLQFSGTPRRGSRYQQDHQEEIAASWVE